MERIGLSGIYIFDTLDGEDKRQPTCIEDCRNKTRQTWLKSLNRMALDNTLSIVLESHKKLAEMLTDEEMMLLIDDVCTELHNKATFYGVHRK